MTNPWILAASAWARTPPRHEQWGTTLRKNQGQAPDPALRTASRSRIGRGQTEEPCCSVSSIGISSMLFFPSSPMAGRVYRYVRIGWAAAPPDATDERAIVEG